MLSIANEDASVPLSRYANVLLSASVAAMVALMFVPDVLFSAMERVVLSPSVNTGALFDGVSSKFVTLIVVIMLSVRLPSETVIVTV